MRNIDKITWSTDPAVGSDGSATATGFSPTVNGRILAVHVNYEDSPPATTDFTLVDESDPAAEAIVSLADANTDIKIYPRRVTEKNDGTDILYTTGEEVHDNYIVAGRLKSTIAGANANDYIKTTVWFER